MRGPNPKPPHLRQRTNRKPGARTLAATFGLAVPELQNPDGRTFHPLTLKWWANAWASEMAAEWIKTDTDALVRLAWLWDESCNDPGNPKLAAEIRQQERRFGYTPMDRSNLDWEILKVEEAEQRIKGRAPAVKRASAKDPRAFLKGLK